MKAANKKVEKSIVLCGNYNGHQNVLFLMKHDDFLFNTDKYRQVTGVKMLPGRHVMPDGRKVQHFQGNDGHTYMVFSDWSAKRIDA
jgi:hypothetical protein